MMTLFNELLKAIDAEWLLENTEKLWKIELGQCHRHYREAAKFTERLMSESGLKQVERIVFPADGKTSYEDKTMPLAWDATMGRLTVVHSPVPFENPVVADFHRHPFHLVRGSVSTPPGGIVTRLITEEQLFGGCETANAMVITNPETRPRGGSLCQSLRPGRAGNRERLAAGPIRDARLHRVGQRLRGRTAVACPRR